MGVRVTYIQAALLGLIQGLSEFLPISSSGHLVLGQALLDIDTGDITFEVIVHFGTLLAVLTALRGRVLDLIRGCLKRDWTSWKMVLFLGIGTVPAGVVGLLFRTLSRRHFPARPQPRVGLSLPG